MLPWLASNSFQSSLAMNKHHAGQASIGVEGLVNSISYKSCSYIEYTCIYISACNSSMEYTLSFDLHEVEPYMSSGC